VSVYWAGVKITYPTTNMCLMLLCGVGTTSQYISSSSKDMPDLFPLPQTMEMGEK